MDTPCHPPREVATGQRSLAGRRPRPGTAASRPCGGNADQPNVQQVGERVRRRPDAALDTLPRRTVGWERPRSGGADGDVHRHPSRCRSRHAEMGGRSQPRPRWPDRHRRSGGRGTTASAPATYGTGGVSIADAISCPATPEAPCTLVDRHRYGRPAVKTGPPTDGSNATTGRTSEAETPSGYAFASATTLWRTRAADMRAVTTGGAALRHHAAPTRGKGGGAPHARPPRERDSRGDRRGAGPTLASPGVLHGVGWLVYLSDVRQAPPPRLIRDCSRSADTAACPQRCPHPRKRAKGPTYTNPSSPRSRVEERPRVRPVTRFPRTARSAPPR